MCCHDTATVQYQNNLSSSSTVRVCVCGCEKLLTSLFGRQAAHPSAHGSESTQVFLQTLVGLLVQPSHGPELGPVEPAEVWIKNDAESGDHAVEVGLLSSGPSRSYKTFATQTVTYEAMMSSNLISSQFSMQHELPFLSLP